MRSYETTRTNHAPQGAVGAELQHPNLGGAKTDLSIYVVQHYQRYTSEDHATWKQLCDTHVPWLESRAASIWLRGFRELGVDLDHIPHLNRTSSLNQALLEKSNFRMVPVNGYIQPQPFLKHLLAGQFPCAVGIRSRGEIDYSPVPDVFQDAVGHAPLLMNSYVARLHQAFGMVAVLGDADLLRKFNRLYGWAIERSLVREDGELKLLGTHLITSRAEGEFALSSRAEKIPFDLGTALLTDVALGKFQPFYFVAESVSKLTADIFRYTKAEVEGL